MGGVQEAVSTTDGGTLLSVELTPEASEDAFPAGYNPWRDRVEARVQAPARDGEANRALIELVATYFDVPGSDVWIKAGARSRRKTIGVRGLDEATVRDRLAGVLEG